MDDWRSFLEEVADAIRNEQKSGVTNEEIKAKWKAIVDKIGAHVEEGE